jgi:ABC-type sulfate/molybdate transport systems ATPase subunit
LEEGHKYIGIHAHHIEFVDQSKQSKLDNVFVCKVVSCEEGPHTVAVYVRIGDLQSMSDGYHLQIEVYKERWREISNDSLLYVHLHADKLFLCS